MGINLFKSKYNLLKRASPAKPGKRFASLCIDFVIVFICTILLFSLGEKIVESTSQYKDSYKTYQREIEFYNDLIVDTHLVKEGDKREEYYDYFSYVASENIYRAINLNYETKNHDDYPDYIISDKIKEYGIASKENDNIAYFYLEYVPNNNEDIHSKYGEYSDQKYLKELYREYFNENFSLMFYDSDDSIPVLKTDVAYSIWYYIECGEKSDANSTLVENGAAYYQTFQNAYANMLEDAETKLYNSKPYYSTHYIKYEESVYQCAKMMNVTLLICVICSSLIFVMIPKFIFSDEVTFGRKIMGLGVINFNGTKTKKSICFLKSIIASIFFYISAIMISLQSLLYPISISNNFKFIYLVLFLVVLLILNGCVCLFTHHKRTLLDIIFKTKVVDLKHIDEGDYDEKEEAMPY